MITAGIDCGAKNTQTVVMDEGRVIARATVLTGFDLKNAARESLAKAVQAAGIDRATLGRVGGTGSGKNSIDMADAQINDIEAMARGAHHFFPSARTVVDVGAEEGRAAKIDEGGNVVDFAVNEKCAAGAGVFVEFMARALGVNLEEMGRLSLSSEKPIALNAQCAVFAEAEVVGLIHAGASTADISKSIHDAMASRIVSMLRRVGVNEDVVMLGGLGYNQGFVNALRIELKLDTILIPEAPEYGAAVGAALGAALRPSAV